ncbi:MAG: hypothetical protein U1F64_10765 [Burkholderiales bacterium]
MSQWRTTFEGQQPLEKVREALRALEAANPEGLAAVDLAAYARLLRLLRLLETAFERLDPELYHVGIWTNVGSWLTNARNFAGNFAGDKNPSHLQQANANVDEVINVVRPLEILGERAVEAVSKAASVYEKKLLDELEATRTRHAQLKAEFDVLASEITQARARLVANDQVIEQQKARLDQAIADFQKQYSTAESTRASGFATASSRMQSESSSQLKTLSDQWAANAASKEKEWAAMVQGATAEADKQTEYFEGRRAEVDKILGAIGSASLAGHFAKTANDDSKAANILRRIALGLMCLMIVVAGLSFFQSFIHPEIDWKIFLFRLATVLVIAIPALYAAQESNKHRQRERYNRKMQVELASIDAYLVKLPPDKQDELKAKLTDRFFGQPDVAEKDEPITKHQLLELVSDALKNLTKAK